MQGSLHCFTWARHRTLTLPLSAQGDKFPRRLCDPLPPVTAVLYYRWLAAGLHDKIISQAAGGHRIYMGIRHPSTQGRVV